MPRGSVATIKKTGAGSLSFTDPSGFFLSGFFRAIGNFFRSIGRLFAHAAKAIIRSSIGRAIIQIIACAPGPWVVATCAAAAAGLTLAAGGSITQALISAAISFAQIPVKYGGLGIWDGVGNFVGQIAKQGVPQFLGEAATHAVVGGAISMAQGGSFASGAISGAVGAAGSEFAGAIGAGDFASRTAISAIAGGTASVLSGGKFVNGAVTAAFATMYNFCQHNQCLPDFMAAGTMRDQMVANANADAKAGGDSYSKTSTWDRPSGWGQWFGGDTTDAWKCNYYLFDKLTQAGIPAPFVNGGFSILSSTFATDPVSANQYKDLAYGTPGFRTLPYGREPEPGDIGAFGGRQHEGGHVAIYVGNERTVSATQSGVRNTNWGFKDGMTPIWRRFTGQ